MSQEQKFYVGVVLLLYLLPWLVQFTYTASNQISDNYYNSNRRLEPLYCHAIVAGIWPLVLAWGLLVIADHLIRSASKWYLGTK